MPLSERGEKSSLCTSSAFVNQAVWSEKDKKNTTKSHSSRDDILVL